MTVTSPDQERIAGRLADEPRRWSPQAARRVVLSVLVATLLANSLPLALLPVYQDSLGLRPGAIALIAAVPTVGILLALVTGSRISDALGRRVTLLIGVGLAFLGVAFLIAAHEIGVLLVGRVLVGAAVGVVSSAGTAALVDVAAPADRPRAAVAGAAAAVAGIAAGPALGGLVVQHLPSPMRLVLVVELVVLAAGASLLARLPETVPRADRPTLRAVLHPQLPRTPPRLRTTARRAAVAVVPAWAVMGLMLAVSPGLLTRELGVHDLSAVSALVALFLGVSAVAQIGLRHWPARRAALVGLILLPTGLLCLALVLTVDSVLGFAIVAVTLGAGHGMTQVSAQAEIGAKAAASERAAAFGALLLVTYTAASVPAVVAGYTAQVVGLVAATVGYAAVVAVLAVVAWWMTWRSAGQADSVA